ncbi:tripartite tricarboxylate transporter substrate binding protein [Aquincola tertiaricarbonis]|uniref:tripartite tricarboxylate transporter substrate binding protein n=1 Tax=Aquincola tertiaricarbonis TaxID=391953 RepID=UPI0006152670|nr:tripartite tricarboxylate transporter substrate binding protein [Aquincola tertiaricarbonis]
MRTLAGAALIALLTQPALASWPDDKPIEIVVGFAAGGGTDLLARKLAPFVQKRLGGKSQFIVVNKPGAAGEIANAYLARAQPDGYTIGIVNVPGFLFLPMTKKAQYAPEDMRLLARIVDDPTVLVTRADSPLSSLPATVAALRAKPGSVSVGHNGTGTNGDLALQLLTDATKAEANFIPFKGTSAQKTDLMGGHLDVAAISAGEVPELHGGKTAPLKVLVQFSAKRSAALPNVPTAQESGIPVVMSSERGFAAPKGVPDAIVQKLEAAIAEAVRDPEFVAGAAGDAPVLAYLPGAQWNESLNQNRKALRALADKMPK